MSEFTRDPFRIWKIFAMAMAAAVVVLCTLSLFFVTGMGVIFAALIVGTVIFSVSAGFSEVLLSPTIAAMPSENPQRDMSLLHSLYAFGVCTMVLLSTLFLKIFGTENWMYLILLLAVLPVFSAILFMISPFPDMDTASTAADTKRAQKRTVGMALCVGCIFFGSCAENAMSNWISGFMDSALGLDKAIGDILGAAMFAILLGLARISYARFGKNIIRTLFLGMIGATICYVVVGLSSSVIPAFIACILTGFCTAMLWPGTLIMMEEKMPNPGVAAFALMAAGGDLGASIAPQLLGIVTDRVAASRFAAEWSQTLSLTPDQIGLKAGMLVMALFPLLGTILLCFIVRYFKRVPPSVPAES